MSDLYSSLYVTDLDAEIEASSLYVTTKCMTSSSTSIGKPYPLTEYVENPSPTRASEYQMRRNIRGWVDWRQEVTLSHKAYEKSGLTS